MNSHAKLYCWFCKKETDQLFDIEKEFYTCRTCTATTNKSEINRKRRKK